MNFRRTAILAAAVVFLLLAVACSKSPTPTGITGDAQAGKQLFEQYCVSCHKADGSGGVQVGGATSADIRWSTLGPLYKNNIDLVKAAILTGKDQDGQDLDSAMPRWQGTLSEQNVASIIAYLQTLK